MRAHLDLGAANPAAQTQLPIAAGCFLPSLRGQIFLFSCSAGDVLRQKYRVSYINPLTHLEIRGHLLVDFMLQVPFCIFRGLKTALDLLSPDLSIGSWPVGVSDMRLEMPTSLETVRDEAVG